MALNYVKNMKNIILASTCAVIIVLASPSSVVGAQANETESNELIQRIRDRTDDDNWYPGFILFTILFWFLLTCYWLFFVGFGNPGHPSTWWNMKKIFIGSTCAVIVVLVSFNSVVSARATESTIEGRTSIVQRIKKTGLKITIGNLAI